MTATRYVTKLREGGSLPGLVEADDDGLYVVKFSGAGQGPKALVAELVAAGLLVFRSHSRGGFFWAYAIVNVTVSVLTWMFDDWMRSERMLKRTWRVSA